MKRGGATGPGRLVDVDHVAAPGFGLADELAPGGGHWHAHDVHQILYVSDGAVRLELERATWLLPSARAAWITAGTRHRIDVVAPAALRTTYLTPALMPPLPTPCGVFGVTPLAREMLLQAAAWGPERVAEPALAPVCGPFFAALAALVGHWASAALPFVLPRATSRELARATSHLAAHLDAPLDVAALAKKAALSPRTLNRRFRAETGLAPRAWLHHARMLHAIERLADPTTRVTEVALDCGYQSLPTFSRQFAAFTGLAPRAFRARQRA